MRGSGLIRRENDKSAIVLHYPYARFADMLGKAQSSGCPHIEAARSGERSALKECFVLAFDADVFLASAQNDTHTLQQLYERRVMLPQGEIARLMDGGFLMRLRSVASTLMRHEIYSVCSCERRLVQSLAKQAQARREAHERLPDREDTYLLRHS